MKTYKQTSEIIDDAILFHTKMREFYEQLHKKTEKVRVKMLLEFLCQHEKHREEALVKYEKEASSKVLDSWFKYIPEEIPDNCFRNIEISSDMSVDDVVCCSLHLNNYLIKLYKSLINETNDEETRDVINSLLKKIEKEERNLVRDVSRLNDI